MHRGRYQLGQEIVLGFQARNGSDVPAVPSAVPVFSVYSQSATLIDGKEIPVLDRYGRTGLFQFRLRLSSIFTAGNALYTVSYKATMPDSHIYTAEDYFQVIAGGNADGVILSMAYYTRPHADFVVHFLDSGKIQARRNPSG